ncbi:MAG: hypothetical protein WCJ39_09770 [bacterium]
MENIIGSILIVLITLACLYIQVKGIAKGIYDSSLASWVIWTAIFMFLFIINLVHDGWSAITVFLAIQGVAHVAMIFITYKYVSKTFSKDEIKLLSISVIGFLLWIGSYIIGLFVVAFDPLVIACIGIAGQIVADAAGAIPYMKIVYKTPQRQPLSAWIINMLVYPVTAYGTYVHHESWTDYLFLVYAFFMYGTLLAVLIIARRRIRL